ELGDFPTARADFDAVLANPPEPLAGSVALVNRGVLAMRQRDWDGAVADFRLAIRQESPALPAYVNLALTHPQRVGWPAWRPPLWALGPRGASALAAVEAPRRRALGEAVAALDRAAARWPGEGRLYHERGRLHLALGDHRRARADFLRAVSLPTATLA